LSEEQKALNIPQRDYLVVKTEDGRTEFKLLPSNLQLETFSKSAVEFTLSEEYQEGLQDYLDAMKLEAGNVEITEETRVINEQEYRFLIAVPDINKLTDLQNKYQDVFSSTKLFMWDESINNGKGGWRIFTEADFLEIHKVEFGYAAGKRSDEITSKILNQVPLWISDWELHWNTSDPPLRPSPSEFDFKAGDLIVSDAIEAGKRIQIHHLLFGNQATLPEWLLNIDDNDELVKIINEHASKVVSHYRELIFDLLKDRFPGVTDEELIILYREKFVPQYTAVNEVIPLPWANDTFWTNKFNPSFDFAHIRPNDSSWLERVDTTPIESVFNAANKADPDAILIYNEAGVESIDGNPLYDIQGYKTRSDMTYELVKHLVDKSVPIHGIGLQMHLYGKDFISQANINNWQLSLRENIRRYKELGLKVFVTEMDVRMAELSNLPQSEQNLIQAKIYKITIQTLIEEGVDSIAIFGVLDKDSWLENPSIAGQSANLNNPLIFIDPDGRDVDLSKLYQRNDDDELIYKRQVLAFELFAATKAGQSYLKDRAQEGFEFKAEFISDASFTAESAGQLSGKIDVIFGVADLSEGIGAHGKAPAKMLENGKLSLSFLMDDGVPNAFDFQSEAGGMRILKNVDTWHHEVFIHGEAHENRFNAGDYKGIVGVVKSQSYEHGSPYLRNKSSYYKGYQTYYNLVKIRDKYNLQINNNTIWDKIIFHGYNSW